MLSTFGAASSRAFGHTSGGELRFTSSQVLATGVAPNNGVYTPTAGTKAALFMAFGAKGARNSSASLYWYGGGGGAYGEKYVDSLDASYNYTLFVGATISIAGMLVPYVPANSRNGASSPSGSSTHDYGAGGGLGGNAAIGNFYGYGGGGGGRCGTGGLGPSWQSQGYDSTGGAPVPNSGNEAAGVFDLSPFGITFTYDRYSSQVPKFNAASTAAEIALRGHLNTAAGSDINGGFRGYFSSSSGRHGSIVVIEFS